VRPTVPSGLDAASAASSSGVRNALAQRRQERVGGALQRARHDEDLDRRRERRHHRQRGVGEVGEPHGARDPHALADRARHELQRRERHEVGGDRPRHLRRARPEGVAQLRDQHGEDRAAEGAEEPACVEPDTHQAA
jgi:hypothetical protein